MRKPKGTTQNSGRASVSSDLAKAGTSGRPARTRDPGIAGKGASSFGFEDLEGGGFQPQPSSRPLAEQARRILERSKWSSVNQDRLSRECRALLARLKETCQGVIAYAPVSTGAVAGNLDLDSEQLQNIFALAAGSKDSPQVVWSDGFNELLVDMVRLSLSIRDGVLLVSIPVACEETGPQEIRVAFATGSPDNPAGLIFAADAVPDGPSEIVEIWGEQLVALAWTSLLRALATLAAQAGTDLDGIGLIPSALTADRSSIRLQLMARHEMDRGAR